MIKYVFLSLTGFFIYTHMKRMKNNVIDSVSRNNPANLEHGLLEFGGVAEEQPHNTYITFNTPQDGITALAYALRKSKAQANEQTLWELLKPFSASTLEGHIEYVDAVANYASVSPHDVIVYESLEELIVEAVIFVETGSRPYSHTQIELAVDEAGNFLSL